MKRTPTAEEREREAKVCPALRNLGFFCALAARGREPEGFGCMASGRTGLIKPRRERALPARKPEMGLCIRAAQDAGLVLLDQLTDEKTPLYWFCFCT